MIIAASDIFYAHLMDPGEVSTLIMRYPANENRPEHKRFIRRLIEMIRGRGCQQ